MCLSCGEQELRFLLGICADGREFSVTGVSCVTIKEVHMNVSKLIFACFSDRFTYHVRNAKIQNLNWNFSFS